MICEHWHHHEQLDLYTACDLTMEIAFLDTFAQTYIRNNKQNSVKNLRCFPHCDSAQGHVTSGFCGDSVKILCKQTPLESHRDGDLPFLGEFSLCETPQRAAVGQKVNLSSPDWKSLLTGQIIHGADGDNPNELVVLFCPDRGWCYDWRSHRHLSDKEHCFNVYVFRPEASTSSFSSLSDSNSVCVGVGSSPSFRLISRQSPIYAALSSKSLNSNDGTVASEKRLRIRTPTSSIDDNYEEIVDEEDDGHRSNSSIDEGNKGERTVTATASTNQPPRLAQTMQHAVSAGSNNCSSSGGEGVTSSSIFGLDENKLCFLIFCLDIWVADNQLHHHVVIDPKIFSLAIVEVMRNAPGFPALNALSYRQNELAHPQFANEKLENARMLARRLRHDASEELRNLALACTSLTGDLVMRYFLQTVQRVMTTHLKSLDERGKQSFVRSFQSVPNMIV